jgi:hypothetical protein
LMLSHASRVQGRPAAQLSSSLQQSHHAWSRHAAAQCSNSRCCIRATSPGRRREEVGRCYISRRRGRPVLVGHCGQVVAGDPAVPTWSSAGLVGMCFGPAVQQLFCATINQCKAISVVGGALIGIASERVQEVTRQRVLVVCQWPAMRQRRSGSWRLAVCESCVCLR